MTTLLKLSVYGENEKYVGKYEKYCDFRPSDGDLVRPFKGGPDLKQAERVWLVSWETGAARMNTEVLEVSLSPVFKQTRDEYGSFVSGLSSAGWRKAEDR